MDGLPGYIEKNKELWNERTAHHVTSDFYEVAAFKKGKSMLNEIELQLLGDVKNKKILHLQCHFGLDTLSLARAGAQVTGVDFSDKAIETANALAAELAIDATFICSDIYELKNNLQEQFDIVFTSYGVIGWLPDMEKWAAIIQHFLKPGGVFVMAEFHPVVWMYDTHFTKIEYSYFKEDPIIEMEEGTYADIHAPLKKESISWNHSLGEVLSALLQQGLTLTAFHEYNYSPFNCFLQTEKIAEDKFVIKPFAKKLPLVYSLKAIKTNDNSG